MKLIESSAEYIPQEDGIEGVYLQIEKAARICYKSEAKCDGTYESALKFVEKLIDRGHTAMLEHGTIYLKKYMQEWLDINKGWQKSSCNYLKGNYEYNPYSKTNTVNSFLSAKDFTTPHDSIVFITTNLRVLYENNWEGDLSHELQTLCAFPEGPHEKRYTLKLVTSIGIVRELLRHRVFSFANESTRYCNYSTDKFSNELTFIKPYWYKQFDAPIYNTNHRKYGTSNMFTSGDFVEFLRIAETNYLAALIAGSTPQQAREVLPLCTKSELIMTGFESDWKHFLDLRLKGVAGEPHPDMKILAKKIRVELLKAGFDYNKIYNNGEK